MVSSIGSTQSVDAAEPLPGYQLIELLYEGPRTLVYQGHDRSANQSVIVKLPRQEFPSLADLVQWRNQYTVTQLLNASNAPGIIRSLALVPYRNSYALVLEDFGGISLGHYLTQASAAGSAALPIAEVLAIAQQLCISLHQLYEHRVIHKDIKPANILIHPETKQVKLTDFSIASQLPRETQELQSTQLLQGTLAYLSPEQTGRMNRGIDYRSDFYALGVTLFELFTGQLPFPTHDPLDLIHSHLAKHPPSIHELRPEVPKVLSDIVAKLLAKTAEDRYQSASGLQCDLQHCLEAWIATGTIAPFSLGTTDQGHNFVVSEKLYGREADVAALLNAFDHMADGIDLVESALTQQLVLVAGFSGIGKTAVVNEVHKPILRRRGYFIKGKYDQFQRDIPFSAMVQAFRDLMAQILAESDAALEQWKQRILNAIGDSGQVIIDVVPELEHIIGSQPPVPNLTGTARQNRFNRVFQGFVQVFATAEHPLVMFLDDLQWADVASLQLLKLLLSDPEVGCLLMIGAYRDNEVSPGHLLTLALDDMRRTGITPQIITLQPLTEPDVNCLVADTLNTAPDHTAALTHLIYQTTQGNPFFTSQCLKALHADHYIRLDATTQTWVYDLLTIQQLVLTGDVVEFMAQQLQKLPMKTQAAMQLAACLGNQFDLDTLAIAAQQSEFAIAATLWPALETGLIVPMSDDYKIYQDSGLEGALDRTAVHAATPATSSSAANPTYRFLHDRVQQAAYALIPSAQIPATHLTIGQRLLAQIARADQGDRCFEIVNQLNQGVGLITDAQERQNLAQLNLTAGRKAKASTAYATALRYFQQGIECLPSTAWAQTYPLALSLHSEAAEVAYLYTDYEQSAALVAIIERHARDTLDQIKVYELKIQFYLAQLKMTQALETGMAALHTLNFPIANELGWNHLALPLPQVEDLDQCPLMTAPQQLAVLRILSALTTTAYQTQPEFFGWIVQTQFRLCVEQGHSALAPFAYIAYAWLCGAINEVERAHQAGQVAIALLDQWDVKDSRILHLFEAYVRHRKEHTRATFSKFQDSIHMGLETGNLEYATYSAMNVSAYRLFSGEPLDEVRQAQAQSMDVQRVCKQEFQLTYNQLWQQVTLNLQGEVSDPCLLVGQCFDETVMLPRWQAAQNHQSLCAYHLSKLILHYLFGHGLEAAHHAREAAHYMGSVAALMEVAVYCCYGSLGLLAQMPTHAAVQQTADWATVLHNQTILHNWAQHAPMNYGYKYDLVEAERHRVLGDRLAALDYYDRAIAQAGEHGNLQDEALANELAARFFLEWGKDKLAQPYLIAAYYRYGQWGAIAKVTDLEHRYTTLLAPILTPTASLVARSTDGVIGNAGASLSSNLTTQLDLATILKASQAVSSEIELSKLLETLMQVMMETAGADGGALVLDAESWTVAVACSGTDCTLQPVPLEDSSMVPQGILHYVRRTQEPLVLHQADQEAAFAADPYMLQHQPQSLLCLPIFRQSQLIGVLYLENRLVADVFTSDRQELLQLLCAQAAISLQNARLYQQAQDTTHQLERSLQDLQQMQLQLVQSEKMSTLGNLVAGIAHEINNPLAFLSGNLKPAQLYVADLLGLIDQYQQHYPTPAPALENYIEVIDLEYLRSDLPKLIESMNLGVDRIRGISTSLRTFSRADKDHKVPFNIHDGLDSTLLILKHRLKSTHYRCDIEIVKDYGDLPLVECFPGQLNQVFMNLLANAVDALDEFHTAQPMADLTAVAVPTGIESGVLPFITIRTQVLDDNRVQIAIADNGPGIPEHVRDRIFDHLFTTKAVGKGTGFGLAIARQIVEETHDGILRCQSILGEGSTFIIEIPADLA